MKRPMGDVFADWIGIKTTGPKPILNWEGIYFFAVGILLLFQEYYLTVEISGVITNSRFLVLYAHFTASILFANRFLVAPFLGFFLYASLRSTSLGLPRRLCDLLGVYYLMRMVTLLIGLNILIFDVTSSRYVLITQLLFFCPTPFWYGGGSIGDWTRVLGASAVSYFALISKEKIRAPLTT